MTSQGPLSQNVQALIRAVESTPELTPPATKRLLEEAELTFEDLEPWADFDHPNTDSYGRKLVWDGGFFELMVMSWVDGDMAAIHDHGHAQWGAVRLFGDVEHAIFKIDGGTLTTLDRQVLPSGTVVAVSRDLIHQMGNVGQEPYLTLHLYGCYGRRGDVTGDARLYELDEGVVQRTSGGVFFGLPEDQIECRESAPEADFPTFLRYKVELLKRLLTAHDTWSRERFQSERESRLAGELFAATTYERLAEEWRRVEAKPSAQIDRYCAVLHQELRAAAALQKGLVVAGLAQAPFEATRLAELLACEKLEDLAAGYLDLLSATYDLPLPEMAAAA